MAPRRTVASLILALAVTLALAEGPAWAQQPLPPSIAEYNRAVADDKLPVERLFELGEKAARDLQSSGAWPNPNKPGGVQELAVIAEQMPGYIGYLPKIAFFEDLSRRRGRPEDVAFFSALADEFPYGVPAWPDYIRQTTDEQGCRRLDGTLTRIASTWRRYRAAYPHAYARHVAHYLDETESVISSMIEGTYKYVCACGELPAAERELTDLARLGPQDRLGKSAADLLRGIRDHSVKFEANCRPN